MSPSKSLPFADSEFDRLFRGYAWALLLVTGLHAGAWWWSHHRELETITPAVVPQMVEVELMSAPPPEAVARLEPPAPTPAKPEPKPRQPDPKPVVKPPPKKVAVTPKPKPPKAPSVAETDDLAPRLRQLKESLGRESPPPRQASVSSAAPSRPVTPSGGGARHDPPATTARADHLHNPKPSYPAVARARNWEGVSRLRIYVLPNGSAGQVQLAGSSGHDVLDSAALAAVKSWRFVPAKRGDQAIASWVQFPIVWKLQ